MFSFIRVLIYIYIYVCVNELLKNVENVFSLYKTHTHTHTHTHTDTHRYI